MRMSKPRESQSVPKSQNHSVECSREMYEQTWEFLNKVKEMDGKDRRNRRIFLNYIEVMKLFRSGSLSIAELKNKVATIFTNCDELLDGFHRLMKNGNDDVVVDPWNLEWIKGFNKMLSEDLRLGFVKSFKRYKVHENVTTFKEEVDAVLRDFPYLREEFRMVLVHNGLLVEPRRELTAEEEDELFESDMYYESLSSAIWFAEEGDPLKPPVGVYGAMRRFYKERGRTWQRGPLVDLKPAVQRILPALQRKYLQLEEEKAIRHARCTT